MRYLSYTALVLLLLIAAGQFPAMAQMRVNPPPPRHDMRPPIPPDTRLPIRVPPMMKSHMLWKMRDHLAAVNESIRLMSLGDFEAASRVIHDRLGTSEEMTRMCGMFGNEAYRDMGLAMHASADALAVDIRSKDMMKIMNALSRTMERCVTCHNTFRVE